MWPYPMWAIPTEKALPRQPGSAMYSGLARHASRGSLHLAVAIRSGLARQSSTVNPFYVVIIQVIRLLVPTLAARVAPHLGGVVEAVVRVPAPGPGGGVLDRASNEGSLRFHIHRQRPN